MEAVGLVEDVAIISKIRHSGTTGLSLFINLNPPLCSSVRLYACTFKLVDIGLSSSLCSHIYRVFKNLYPPSRAETRSATANPNIAPCSTTKMKWIAQISASETS